MEDALERLRAICLGFPEVEERLSHGSPSFFVRGKKQFVSVDDHHHGVTHFGFWCPAAPGVQDELVGEDPDRYFRPPYVGPSGWLGVRLEADGLPEPDWDEVAEIVADAYRKVAPKTLLEQLDGPPTGAA
ncbi:MmcQ/YjbR family DNA-binding protein [Jatrophihabitans fulvus]